MPLQNIFNDPLSHSQDTLLLLKKRDGAFLEKTFRETNPLLLRLLAANGIYAETAEDIVHQTWERFFTNIDQFEGRSELKTFICGILINKIREHRRIAGRMIFDEDAETVMARSFTSDGWWNMSPSDPSVFLYSSQVSGFVAECLEGLSELQKSAFVLKELEQQDSIEICNVLDVSVSNLRVLLFRAKDKLRQCLEGKLGSAEQM